MNKVVADALTLVYKFLMPLCSKFNPALIERGLLSIAGEDAFDFSSQLMPLGSYEKVQSTLARLNERESIRKNKGVYYTPTDVVDFIVANTKYKVSGRPDRADSHQLLAYVLLTGVDRCAFILPNTETKIREMETTGDQFLTLASQNIRYYEMLLGHDYDPNTLKSVLM